MTYCTKATFLWRDLWLAKMETNNIINNWPVIFDCCSTDFVDKLLNYFSYYIYIHYFYCPDSHDLDKELQNCLKTVLFIAVFPSKIITSKMKSFIQVAFDFSFHKSFERWSWILLYLDFNSSDNNKLLNLS